MNARTVRIVAATVLAPPLASLLVPLLALLLVASVPVAVAQPHPAPLCLHVTSGEAGGEWTGGIERGLHRGLDDGCRLETLYLDAHPDDEAAASALTGDAVRFRVETLAPAVVIVSGQRAAAALLAGADARRDGPAVVLAGTGRDLVRSSAPPTNVTGMLERRPVVPMIREAARLVEGARRAIYLGADTPAAREDYRRIQRAARPLGLTVDRLLTDRFSVWKRAFAAAQSYDVVLLGDSRQVRGWNAAEARRFVRSATRSATLTNSRHMLELAGVGFAKIAEEHGEWAGRSALALLAGTPASRIPLISSRRWTTWVNLDLMARSGLTPDRELLLVARQVGQP